MEQEEKLEKIIKTEDKERIIDIVKVNQFGQMHIPKEARKIMGIYGKKAIVLVLKGREEEIIIKKLLVEE